jgi:DNA polymerase-3 subunit alpha
VKNVGEGAALAVIDVRRREGRIRSLFQLCEQLDSRQVNRRVVESLIKAGALDSLGALPSLPTAAIRARLFAAVDKALEHGNRSRRDRDQGQAQLFGGAEDQGENLEADLPEAPAWTEAQQLAGEKEALGLYWSGHPIERYAPELKAIGARSLAELLGAPAAGTDDDAEEEQGPRSFEVAIGGIIASVRPLKTKKGDRMAAFVLDDPHGTIEVVAFPETYAKHGAAIQADAMVLVKGKFERDEESSRLMASEIAPIEVVTERAARVVSIRLAMPPHGRDTIEALADLISRHKGDRRVCLEVELRGRGEPLRVRADVLGPLRVKPSAQFVADVEKLCGAGSVTLR